MATPTKTCLNFAHLNSKEKTFPNGVRSTQETVNGSAKAFRWLGRSFLQRNMEASSALYVRCSYLSCDNFIWKAFSFWITLMPSSPFKYMLFSLHIQCNDYSIWFACWSYAQRTAKVNWIVHQYLNLSMGLLNFSWLEAQTIARL